MAFAPPTDMPIEFGLRVDAWTIVYTAAVSLVTGIVFGLAPAWQASRPETVSYAGTNERPSAGSTPIEAKKLPDTNIAVRISGDASELVATCEAMTPNATSPPAKLAVTSRRSA